MGAPADLPGGYNGQTPAAYADLNIGLGEGTTGYGSGLLLLNGHVAATAVAVKFVVAQYTGLTPLELYFRYFDGTTQVAGMFATSEDGVSSADLSSTLKRRVDATGYTFFACYDLAQQGGTIYMATDADPGSDGVVDYHILYGRNRDTA